MTAPDHDNSFNSGIWMVLKLINFNMVPFGFHRWIDRFLFRWLFYCCLHQFTLCFTGEIQLPYPHIVEFTNLYGEVDFYTAIWLVGDEVDCTATFDFAIRHSGTMQLMVGLPHCIMLGYGADTRLSLDLFFTLALEIDADQHGLWYSWNIKWYINIKLLVNTHLFK